MWAWVSPPTGAITSDLFTQNGQASSSGTTNFTETNWGQKMSRRRSKGTESHASTSDMAGQDTSTLFTSGQETSSRLEQASASLPVTAGSSNFGTGLTMSPSTTSSSLTSINTSGTQLISSSTVSSSTTTCSSSVSSVNTSGIVNPLVSAGLVSPDLMDILAVPSADAAVSKQRTKPITGARCLTSDEYAEML